MILAGIIRIVLLCLACSGTIVLAKNIDPLSDGSHTPIRYFAKAFSINVPLDAVRIPTSSPDSDVYRWRLPTLSIFIEHNALADGFFRKQIAMQAQRQPVIKTETGHDHQWAWTTRRWLDPDSGLTILKVILKHRGKPDRHLWQQILTSVRLHDVALDISLVTTNTGSNPSAIVKLGNGQYRKIRIGDYVSRRFGKVVAIASDRLEIEETLLNLSDDWELSRTVLRPQRKAQSFEHHRKE